MFLIVSRVGERYRLVIEQCIGKNMGAGTTKKTSTICVESVEEKVTMSADLIFKAVYVPFVDCQKDHIGIKL
jgi:hypothetical protein